MHHSCVIVSVGTILKLMTTYQLKGVYMGLFDKKKPSDVTEYMNGERTEVENRLLDALKMLRDAGIVSYEEYEEKKAKILEIN